MTPPGYTPSSPSPAPSREPKLLDQVAQRIRRKGYSLRTERSYVGWIKRFILFHGKRHPRDMGKAEVEAFLTSLAVERDVAAATQNQALSAILFLYKEVLETPLPWLDAVERAKKPARLPTVLGVAEVGAVLGQLQATPALMCRLLYGTGMRLMASFSSRRATSASASGRKASSIPAARCWRLPKPFSNGLGTVFR
ncbi:MAG: phage integrase N-terminal SAM-like domain-containing protein [Betaproteobacteria bacterium]|nr:phage integrase N-terminal SAM-like domain-containing protein [Betaproteobacteria bacterium]